MATLPKNTVAENVSADEGLNVVNNALQRLISGKLDSTEATEILNTYTPDNIDFASDATSMLERNRRKAVVQSFAIAHEMANKAQQIRSKTDLLDGQIRSVKALKPSAANTTTIANLQIVRTQYRDMLDALAGLNNERLIADSAQLGAVEEGFQEFKASFSAFVKQTSDHSPSYKFDNEADGLDATSAVAKKLSTNTIKKAALGDHLAFGTMSFQNISKSEQMYIWQQLELRGHINGSVGLIRRVTVAGTKNALAMAGMLEGDDEAARKKRLFLDRYLEENADWLANIWRLNKDLTDLEDGVDKALDHLNDELDHLRRKHPEEENAIRNVKNSRDEMIGLKRMLADIRQQFQNLTPDIDWRILGGQIKDASVLVGKGLGKAGATLGRVAAEGLGKLGQAGAELFNKIRLGLAAFIP